MICFVPPYLLLSLVYIYFFILLLLFKLSLYLVDIILLSCNIAVGDFIINLNLVGYVSSNVVLTTLAYFGSSFID